LGLNYFWGEGRGEEKKGCGVAISVRLSVHLWVAPRPRQNGAKVFEIKELSLDFGCDYGTKVESPACAGRGFFLVLF
jgi:hypothetical protein